MALIVHTEHPMHHFTPFGNKIISKIEINIRSINILFHISFVAFTVSWFFLFRSNETNERRTETKCQKRKRSNERKKKEKGRKMVPFVYCVYCVRLMLRVRSFTFSYVRVFAFVCAIWWNRYFGKLVVRCVHRSVRYIHTFCYRTLFWFSGFFLSIFLPKHYFCFFFFVFVEFLFSSSLILEQR